MNSNTRLFDFITRLHSTQSFVEAWQLYSQELASVGINESLYGCSIVPDTERQHSDYLHINNYNHDFMQEYNNHNMAEHDVLVGYCERHDAPMEWSAANSDLSKAQQEVEDLSNDYQLVHGFAIPLCTLHSKSRGGVGLSATGVDQKEFEADIKPFFDYIHTVTHTFHAFVQKFPCFTESAGKHDQVLTPLTPNERKTLQWLIQGFSIQTIADDKLFKTEHAVNKYLNSAKIKMKAVNRVQLIAKSLILNVL